MVDRPLFFEPIEFYFRRANLMVEQLRLSVSCYRLGFALAFKARFDFAYFHALAWTGRSAKS